MGSSDTEDTRVDLSFKTQALNSSTEIVHELRKMIQKLQVENEQLPELQAANEQLQIQNEQLRRRNYSVPVVVKVFSEVPHVKKGPTQEEIFIELIANDDKSRADFKRLLDMGRENALKIYGVAPGDYPDSLVIRFKVGLYDLEGKS